MKTQKFLFSMMIMFLISACSKEVANTGAGKNSNFVAKGWTSGGGETYKDGSNPWFLQNTKVVNYCIDINTSYFSQTEEVADAKIQLALEYWKTEFGKGFREEGPYGNGEKLEIATQEFKKVNCKDDVDLRFQFGSLSESQLFYIKDPTDFVSAAIRTEYDLVNLKAKGFIYIAADNGPWRPKINSAYEKPWNEDNGNILYVVLTHELGHVFGLEHDISSIMNRHTPADEFRNNLLHGQIPNTFRYVQKWNIDQKYLTPRWIEATQVEPSAPKLPEGFELFKKFWGVTVDCQDYNFLYDKDKITLVACGKYEVGNFSIERKIAIGGFKVAGWFWPGEYQTVFQINSKTWWPPYNTYLIYEREDYTAEYKSTDGKVVRRVFGSISPDGLKEVNGYLDGYILKHADGGMVF